MAAAKNIIARKDLRRRHPMSQESLLLLSSGVGDREMPEFAEIASKLFPGRPVARTRLLEAITSRHPDGQMARDAARKLESLARRAFDMTCAFAGLILLSPLFVIIAAV